MKVLLLSPLPPPIGGIATWTSLFKDSNIARQNEVVIVNTNLVGNRVNNISKRSFLDEFRRTKDIYKKVRIYLKNNDYDIVHINSACGKFGIIRDFLLISRIKRICKAKAIVHFHCDTNYMIKDKIAEFFFKRTCQVADKIFCLNSSSREYVKKIADRNSIVIANFLEERIINSVHDREIAEHIKNVVYVGNILVSKGCQEIIEAAKRMPDINFKMIGHLSEEIKDVPVTENVEFLGQITHDEVICHLIESDLLLFPSYSEGFPFAILEGMACGLPILATPVGAIPDMIEDKGGVMVKIKDIDGIVNGIHYLQSREIRKKMSIWNQAKVRCCYSTEIVIENIFVEYKSA